MLARIEMNYDKEKLENARIAFSILTYQGYLNFYNKNRAATRK